MISKEEFVSLISDYETWNKRLNEVDKILGIRSFEIDWIDYGAKLFDKTLELLFEEEAVDDICWWLWDKKDNSELKIWDKNRNELPTETINDLWEIVKNYRK